MAFFDDDVPSSDPDIFLLQSVPPMYFLPVIQVASCLAFTWNRSCKPRCVVPSLNVLMILKVYVATSNLVGLFIFSFLSWGVLGSGRISISILSACFSGSSVGLLVAASMSALAAVLNCISGLTLALRTNISWFGFNVQASLPIRPLAVAS